MPLRWPTSDSRLIVQAALHGLQQIYRPGLNYAKAGVMLLGLQHGPAAQHELALGDDAPRLEALMAAMDRINERHGPGTVALASAGHFAENRIWSMRQALKTPDYMARWSDIPTALA